MATEIFELVVGVVVVEGGVGFRGGAGFDRTEGGTGEAEAERGLPPLTREDLRASEGKTSVGGAGLVEDAIKGFRCCFLCGMVPSPLRLADKS